MCACASVNTRMCYYVFMYCNKELRKVITMCKIETLVFCIFFSLMHSHTYIHTYTHAKSIMGCYFQLTVFCTQNLTVSLIMINLVKINLCVIEQLQKSLYLLRIVIRFCFYYRNKIISIVVAAALLMTVILSGCITIIKWSTQNFHAGGNNFVNEKYCD